MKPFNILMDTDSYKASHWVQYPPGTTAMYSYLESRGGAFKETVFFGLQYIIKQYLKTRITPEMVEEAKGFWEAHGEPFNYDGWMYIAKDLGGKIPLRIKAVPEGTIVPVHNILMSTESTDPEVPWVCSWFETMLMRVWYPTTVASLSHECRKVIMKALEKTSDAPEAEQPFKHHDFGSRGVSSLESAMIGGAAHLVISKGTDTGAALWMIRNFYSTNPGYMPGFSIPAAEHSTITSWGREGEADAYRNMLRKYGGTGKLLAVVSDSWDIFNAAGNIWGDLLLEEIIALQCVLIVRPDSGPPVETVIKLLKILESKFGTTVNAKGYKVLNHGIRMLQGDGIDLKMIESICDAMIAEGFSITNIAFGMGGGLLQKVDRDTQKFAYKCSEVTVNGDRRDVFKDPVTDPGKKSKKGRLALVQNAYGEYHTIRQEYLGDLVDLLEVVYENGEIKKEYDFETIRKNAAYKSN